MIYNLKYTSPENFVINSTSFYNIEKEPSLIFNDDFLPYIDTKELILTVPDCAVYFLECIIDGKIKLYASSIFIEALIELAEIKDNSPAIISIYSKTISYVRDNFTEVMNYQTEEFDNEWMQEELMQYYGIGMYSFLHHVLIKSRSAAWIAVVKEVFKLISDKQSFPSLQKGYNLLEIYDGMSGADYTLDEMFEYSSIYWDDEKTVLNSRVSEINYKSCKRWFVDFPEMPFCDNFHFKKIANEEAARILEFFFSCKVNKISIPYSDGRKLMATMSSGGYFGKSFNIELYNNHEIKMFVFGEGIEGTITTLASSRDFNSLIRLISFIVFDVHMPDEDYLETGLTEVYIMDRVCDGTSASVCLYKDNNRLSVGGNGMTSFSELHDSANKLQKLISKVFDMDFY